MENTTPETEEVVLCAVKMPASMIRKLDEEARRQGFLRGRSTVIRKLVLEHFQRNGSATQFTQEVTA